MSTDFTEESLTGVELKTLSETIVWDDVPVEWRSNEGAHRVDAVLKIINEIRERLRQSICRTSHAIALLGRCFKTPVAASYVKLVALRGLQRMRILLRQQLASSAPVERLILRNRVRHLFAARPPIAPPYFA